MVKHPSPAPPAPTPPPLPSSTLSFSAWMDGITSTMSSKVAKVVALAAVIFVILSGGTWVRGAAPARASSPPPQTTAAACPTPLTKVTAKLTVANPQLEQFLVTYHGKHPVRPYYPTRGDLFEYAYAGAGNPYTGFDASPFKDRNFIREYPSNAYRMRDALQEAVTKELGAPPRFTVEVGCFVGSGAASVWGPLAKARADGQGIHLCVDTWQGDVNMRLLSNFQRFMDMHHGFPQLHHQFQAHMVQSNLTDTVFPLSLPSIVGARLLAVLDWKIDVVYVDAAHELDETGLELSLYYSILREGGLLMGDDYDSFPAVKHDVDKFAQDNGLQLNHMPEGQWLIKKPGP